MIQLRPTAHTHNPQACLFLDGFVCLRVVALFMLGDRTSSGVFPLEPSKKGDLLLRVGVCDHAIIKPAPGPFRARGAPVGAAAVAD